MKVTQSTKFIIKGLLAIIGLLAMSILAFVVYVIFDLPQDRLQKLPYNQELRTVKLGAAPELQEGVLISESFLKDYLLWSGDGDHVKWWFNAKEQEKGIRKYKGKVEFKKNFNLKYLLKNDCPDLYCLQYRLPFEKIPSLIWKGLIGIEDYRFLDHSGVDLKSIFRAIYHDLKTMKFEQGGSTLTQQLVKNIYYSSEKKLIRKLKEIIVSIYLETKLDKEVILEAYLNEVVWGAMQGLRIKGIYSASLFYFEKSPNELTPFESSILIGLLKGPNYYSPMKHLDRLISRTSVVFNKLLELGLLSDLKSEKWNKKDWEHWQKRLLVRNKNKSFFSIWKAMREPETELSQYELFVFIKTTEDLLNDLKVKYPKEDFAVKAIIGKPNGGKSFRHYSKYERKELVAINEEYHQVGSILKPILYGVYSEVGLDLNEEVKTDPIMLKLKSGNWSPRESHGHLPDKVTYKEALQTSLNRPIIKYANEMGFEKLEERLDGLIPRLKTPLREYPAQLLGAVELSLNEVFKLYTRFINKECMGQAKILDSLADPTKTTIRRRVGEVLGQMKFFGKTGTTNDGVGNWFVSFDGVMLGVIWAGVDGKRPEKGLQLYGSNTAFKVFMNFAANRGGRFPEMTCDFIKAAN